MLASLTHAQRCRPCFINKGVKRRCVGRLHLDTSSPDAQTNYAFELQKDTQMARVDTQCLSTITCQGMQMYFFLSVSIPG